MSKPTVKLKQSAAGVKCAAVSDVGMRRSSNQDSLAVLLADDDRLALCRGHLLVVADGMGAPGIRHGLANWRFLQSAHFS